MYAKDANDKALAALVTLGTSVSRVGRGLELIAAVGAVYLIGRWWTSCGSSIELPGGLFKTEAEKGTGTDRELFICDGCNQKAVCPTCTQKVCAVCKQMPCSAWCVSNASY